MTDTIDDVAAKAARKGAGEGLEPGLSVERWNWSEIRKELDHD